MTEWLQRHGHGARAGCGGKELGQDIAHQPCLAAPGELGSMYPVSPQSCAHLHKRGCLLGHSSGTEGLGRDSAGGSA